jgi:hypothetical protein
MIIDSIITPSQLRRALRAQRKSGDPIGIALVKLGIITTDVLVTYLTEQTNDEEGHDGEPC